MKYLLVFLCGVVVGMILDVVIACLVVSGEISKEEEAVENAIDLNGIYIDDGEKWVHLVPDPDESKHVRA